MNYIEGLLEGIEPEVVENYNLISSKVLGWVKTAVEHRKLDIVRRKALIYRQRNDRDALIAAKDERG